MKYAPTESANAALSIAVNILDALTERGLLSKDQRLDVLDAAINDLGENTVSNEDARRVIKEIIQSRYKALG